MLPPSGVTLDSRSLQSVGGSVSRNRLSLRAPKVCYLCPMWDKDNDSLAAKIGRDLVDSGVPISDILRKAKILASLLKNDEFKSWVDAELKGYDNADEVPDYRKLESDSLGTFAGPGRQSLTQAIPLSILPDSFRPLAEPLGIGISVKQIETSAAVAAKDDNHRVPWPPEAVILARPHVRMTAGFRLVHAWRPVSKAQMEGILDQVRNRLLDFLLQLQHIEPEVMKSEAALRAVSGDKVQNTFNTTILGGGNIVATGTDFRQEVTQVKANDKNSLVGHLRSHGCPEDALDELQAALAQDGERPREQLGEAVKSWFGKMTVRAMEGAWKVGIAVAPSLLKEALFRYYGWS